MSIFKDSFDSGPLTKSAPVIAHVVDETIPLTHRIVLMANRPGTKFAEVESPRMTTARAG